MSDLEAKRWNSLHTRLQPLFWSCKDVSDIMLAMPMSGDRRPTVRRSTTYDEQKALFDRYHAGKEYVIDGVLHTGPYDPPRRSDV